MKKVYNIEIDCPNCALKCQEAVNKLDFVESCEINFITQKMTIDYDMSNDNLKKVVKTCKQIEPDFSIEA